MVLISPARCSEQGDVVASWHHILGRALLDGLHDVQAMPQDEQHAYGVAVELMLTRDPAMALDHVRLMVDDLAAVLLAIDRGVLRWAEVRDQLDTAVQVARARLVGTSAVTTSHTLLLAAQAADRAADARYAKLGRSFAGQLRSRAAIEPTHADVLDAGAAGVASREADDLWRHVRSAIHTEIAAAGGSW